MSAMELQVTFLAGTSLKTALMEAKRLARLLNLAYTLFDFNGVSFAIGQGADLEKAEREYPDIKHIIYS